jgi:hypothetical protein
MALIKFLRPVSSFATAGLLTIGLLSLLRGMSQTAHAALGNTWFASTAGDGSACIQSNPCSLQSALNKAIDGEAIFVESGTYTGFGGAVITLTNNITLYGGWNGVGSGTPVRDPDLYPTQLDGQGMRRVVHISGDITPTLDGFIITRGNATGMLASCPSNPAGCGGGIFVSGAHPVIVNNVITNNIAAITTSGSASGYGGGLYLQDAAQAIISGNLIISNAASTVSYGSGGGLYLGGSSSGMQVQFNQVLSNSATTTNATAQGGGIYGGPDGVLIQGNIFRGNRTNSVGSGSGAAFYQSTGSATYLKNLLTGNLGASVVYMAHSRSLIEGNRLIDNAPSAGFVFINGPTGGGGPTLVNNIVARNGTALSARGWKTLPLTVILLHNTLVGSGTGNGIYVDYYVNLSLTNTIVASYTLGITNTVPASSTVHADHTLFWANIDDGIQGTYPLAGNPAFAADGYHLDPGSAAIDAGVNAGVTIDIDGDSRPIGAGYDMGADERRLYIFLPLVIRK